MYQPAPLRAGRRAATLESLAFRTAPLLLAAIGFTAGILLAHRLWTPPIVSLLTLLAPVAVTLLANYYAPRLALTSLLLVWMLLGTLCATIESRPAINHGLLNLAESHHIDRRHARAHPEDDPTHEADGHLIEGRIFRLGAVTRSAEEQSTSFGLALTRIDEAPIAGGVRITLFTSPGEFLPAFACGQPVRLQIRFHAPDRYLDPGAFDPTPYLLDQGIDALASGELKAVHLEPTSIPDPLPLRTRLLCHLHQAQLRAAAHLDSLPQLRSLPAFFHLTPQDTGTLSAMLFGDRTALDHDVRTAFQRSGAFHLLVVSGLHVSILAGTILWLLRRLRVPPLAATLFTLLLATAYSLLTGFGAPSQRALLLTAVYLLSRLLYRKASALNALSLAALVLLAAAPHAISDAGLQMTLLAVFTLAGIVTPILERSTTPYRRGAGNLPLLALDPHLPPHVTQMRVSLRLLSSHLRVLLPRRIARWLPPATVRSTLLLFELLFASLLVELAMTIPMAIYFHRITLFGIPGNLLGLPLLGILLPVALIAVILSLVDPLLATIPIAATAALLHSIAGMVSFLGQFSLADLRTPMPPPGAIAASLLLLASALWLAHRRTYFQRSLAGLSLLLAAALVLYPVAPQLHRGAMEITAIDVGQGDSLFIASPTGQTLLVDAGGPLGGFFAHASSPTANFEIGEDVVSPYLWSRGIRTLDALALTHAHSDHMGGLPAILRNFHPRELWVGTNPPIPAYKALLSEAARLHITVRPLHASDTFDFGGVAVRVLSPAASYQPKATAENDDSLVLHLDYGSTSVLLSGDAQSASEIRMLALERPYLHSTLLKIGHHGSKTSTTPAFLAAVAPTTAVLSAGRRNPFSHPRIEILSELEQSGVRTFRTDTLGACTFLLDGHHLTASVFQPDQ